MSNYVLVYKYLCLYMYILFIVFQCRIWRPGIKDLLLRPAEPKWPPTCDVTRYFAYLYSTLAGGSILSARSTGIPDRKGRGSLKGVEGNLIKTG